MKIVNAASKVEIEMVHTLLTKKFGQIYADIWKVGVNLSLRVSDLLSIRYDDLDLDKRSLVLVEQKTGKKQELRLNETAISIIKRRRRERPDDVWLFQVDCNRARNRPIGRVSVSKSFKDAGDILGLSINTHSMRKSRGKAMYDAGVPVEKISKVLNHSDTSVTLRYLGITREDVLSTYDDFEL